MTLDKDIDQCIMVNPPPLPKCPDGSPGTLIPGPGGLVVVKCPNTHPPPSPPPVGGIIKVPPGTTNAPNTGNHTGTPSGLGVAKALNSTSPIVFRSTGNATNAMTSNTRNSTAAKPALVYSPTGYAPGATRPSVFLVTPGLPRPLYLKVLRDKELLVS